MFWKEILSYFLTSLLAISTLVIGFNTDFFGLGTDPGFTTFASFTLSILVFLICDRFTLGIRENEHKREVSIIVRDLEKSRPNLDCIFEFTSSDIAMDYLCTRLQYAKEAYNTRISKDSIPPRRDVGDKFTKTIKSALEKGLVYKDILSPGFKDYANDLHQFSSDLIGTYHYKIHDITLPCFLNFIILSFPHGEEELLIGWATSVDRGTEQKAYKINDKRIIDYYKDYYHGLFR